MGNSRVTCFLTHRVVLNLINPFLWILTEIICCNPGLGCVRKCKDNILQGFWWRHWHFGLHCWKRRDSFRYRASAESHVQWWAASEVQRSCQELQFCSESVDWLTAAAAVGGDFAGRWPGPSYKAARKWHHCSVLITHTRETDLSRRATGHLYVC